METNSKISKTQVDRLGERLKAGNYDDADLTLLDEYRRSFSYAYEMLVKKIQNRIPVEPTGRSGKSTKSIVEKLNRESIRLSQMQDIAGCRIVVLGIPTQNLIIRLFNEEFPEAHVDDRRIKPSYGYRAVHVIAEIDHKMIEVQVRTFLQNKWAELSEKLSEKLDVRIKYGGGSAEIQAILAECSLEVKNYEELEQQISVFNASDTFSDQSKEMRDSMDRIRINWAVSFDNIVNFYLREEKKNDFFN